MTTSHPPSFDLDDDLLRLARRWAVVEKIIPVNAVGRARRHGPRCEFANLTTLPFQPAALDRAAKGNRQRTRQRISSHAMRPKFTIQQVSVDGPHAYVKASIVSPQNFAVSKGSLLGGVRLKSFLQEPSPGNYIFQIEEPGEAGMLRTGETVELEA